MWRISRLFGRGLLRCSSMGSFPPSILVDRWKYATRCFFASLYCSYDVCLRQLTTSRVMSISVKDTPNRFVP